MTVASAESRQSVSPHNGGPWTSDWGNVLFAVIVGYVAVYIPWLIFQWGSERTYTFVSELGFLPVMVAGIIFAVRTAFSASPDGRTRGAWIAIALSFLLWLIGDAIWGMAEITQTELPYPSWADFAYFGMYVLLITGILLFPAQRLSRLDRFKFWIDSGIILIGLTVLVGYYLIGPDLLQYAEGASEAATLLAYPSLDILALIAIFSILVRNPNTGSGGVMLLLAAGLLFVVFTDLWWTALAARDQYVSGGLTYAVTYAAWSVGQTLLVTAPQRSYDIFNRSLKPASITTRIEPLRAVLPFAAAGIAIIAVLVATVPSFIDRLGLLVGVMALLPLLIAVRQIITLRENARFRLHQVRRESEERFRALVEYSSDLITVLDHDFICRFQSPSSMELLGMEPERFVGRSLMQWMHHDDQNLMRREINDIIQGTRARAKFEWRVVISGRSDVHLETVVSNELDNPVLNGLVLNSRDITERKQLEDELTYQAYHDALTGLPNRASFLSSLVSSMGQVREGNALALMFLDLDYFKLMNDTLGHEAGDDLLVKVGNRLSDSLRPGDTLGRLAGDEFTVLLLGLRDRDEGIRVGQRILKRLQEPMEVAGEFRQISTSIGLAFTESSQAAPEDLLRRADSAMYVAKRNGRDRIEAFEPWMEAELVASDLDRRDQSASTDDHEERISPVASRFAH